MTNQNTNDYLEKIKWVCWSFRLDLILIGCVTPSFGTILFWSDLCVSRQRLFENLRMLPHAPGVQMQAIPEDAVQEESGDEEDDPDKRIPSE